MNEIGRKIVDKLIELHGSKDFKIAFLSYKRSMWNSMSSVYDECIKSGIDAHVYPIPYLRMDTKEVVSDYEYFENAEDIETLSDPDYIAIHYYYDDLNAVTNMLPEYYTSAIKERYKCKIIFLPYLLQRLPVHFRDHSPVYRDRAVQEDNNCNRRKNEQHCQLRGPYYLSFIRRCGSGPDDRA